MPIVNALRVGKNHHKMTKSMLTINVGVDERDTYLTAADDDFIVAILPPDAIVSNAYVYTTEASQPAAITVGLGGIGNILSGGDATATGKSGTFVGHVETFSGANIIVGMDAAPLTGHFVIVVEYDEYLLNTGELTRIDSHQV